ncbi:MAG: hypothetical protein CVV39_01310 [Planctomycetes bacterium HGW-Planctomycetes-1]|nr:MAG: hypothetical protein CVV39_01310 [Planctomycetes bacterium HGW-Planctomycetes-1]
MPKRILITGATGFVGSWTVRHFKAVRSGVELWATSNEPASARLEVDEFVQADLFDNQAVQSLVEKCRPDEVVHLAGLTGNIPLAELIRVNVIGTENLYNTLITNCDLDKLRIVQVSSAATYGMIRSEELPITEQQQPRPVSSYALSKLMQDYLALSLWRRKGLGVIIARVFNILGPGQPDSLVPMTFIRQLINTKDTDTESFKVGNISSRRDFVDVRDVASAFNILMSRGRPGEIYNVASGEDISIEEVIEKLTQISKIQVTIHKAAERMRAADVASVRADISRIKIETGWEPKISLDDSLKAMWDNTE